MSRNLVLIIVIVLGAIIAATTATAVVVLLAPARTKTVAAGPTTIIPGQPPEILSSMKILPFQLIDQNGDPVDETMLDGKVTIVDFIFTRCPGPCPLMTSEMRRVQQVLEGTGVQIVSFSVDSDYDTPEVLRKYAATNGADLETWTFVTGDATQIADLAIKGLGFALEKSDPSPGVASDGPNILHPTHFILVGPDRQVLAIAGIGNQAHIDLLVDGARRVARGLEGG
jgi:protein SCO1